MGRYYFYKRQEADSLKKIEISWLRKLGYLNIWREGTIQWTRGGMNTGSIKIRVSTHNLVPTMYVLLMYTNTNSCGEKSNYEYMHTLTTTPCNYGGVRYWFICRFCGRRIGVLYMGEEYFKCRHCLNLTYSSRNENKRSDFYPLIRGRKQRERTDKIRVKYYKGKPTKRYQRLLDKGAFVSEEGEYQMFRELERRLIRL